VAAQKVYENLNAVNGQTICLESMSAMITNLLQDLLDLAQIEKNTFQLNKTYFSLFDTIQRAFAIVQPSASLKDVTLVLENNEPQYDNLFKQVLLD